ncbi:Protein of unknown function, partial [Cotesia congregata]
NYRRKIIITSEMETKNCKHFPHFVKIYSYPELTLDYAKDLIENKKINVDEIIEFTGTLKTGIMVNKIYITLIYGAVVNQDEKLIDYLLSKNADVNITYDNDTDNVIHRVVRYGNVKLLKKLIEHGADLNVKRACYYWKGIKHSVLYTAIRRRKYEVIKYLVNEVITSEEIVKGITDISERVWFGRYLIDSSNFSLYHGNSLRFLKLFWNKGIDIVEYKSPSSLLSIVLIKALQFSNFKLAEEVLADGADINCSIYLKDKSFPLTYYFLSDSLHRLAFIVRHPKFNTINAVTEDNRSMLHHLILERLANQRAEFSFKRNLITLLTAGIDVNIVDSDNKLAIDCSDDNEKVQCFKRCIVLLLVGGYYVCNRNVEAVQGPEYDVLRNRCRQEVERMKCMKIGISRMSYYDALHWSIHQMAVYLKFVDLNEIASLNNCLSYYWICKPEKLMEMFPLYGKFLHFKLIKAALRIDLLKQSAEIIERTIEKKFIITSEMETKNRKRCLNFVKIYSYPELTLNYTKDLIENKKVNVDEIIEFKVTYKIDVFVQKVYITLIYGAVVNQDEKLIDYLLSKNADVNITYDNDTDNILYTDWHLLSGIQNLIQINAVTEDNRSMLHHLILKRLENQRAESYFRRNLITLLTAGIDVNIVDSDNKLAIDCSDDNTKVQYFKRCIVLLLVGGYYVCNKNIKAAQGPEYDELRNRCRQEVEKMKCMKIGISRMSYYDALHWSIHQMAVYLKFVDLNEIASLNNCLSYYWICKPEKLMEMFPLYESLLHFKLIKAALRIDLLKQSAEIIESILYSFLPYTFIRDLYSYLSNDDLCKLIET